MIFIFIVIGVLCTLVLIVDHLDSKDQSPEAVYRRRRAEHQAKYGRNSNPMPLSCPKERPAHLKAPNPRNEGAEMFNPKMSGIIDGPILQAPPKPRRISRGQGE